MVYSYVAYIYQLDYALSGYSEDSSKSVDGPKSQSQSFMTAVFTAAQQAIALRIAGNFIFLGQYTIFIISVMQFVFRHECKLP